VTIQSSSPLAVNASITTPGAVSLTATAQSAPETGDDLTVNSGVTIQSTGSSVSLDAGDNVVIPAGATIQAPNSTITITGDANDNGGANVTVDGTLVAQSASIGVDSASPGNDTFDITPSATTPISVTGGHNQNTLNFNADGLAVTIAGNTITAGVMKPVTFTNITALNIIDAANGGASFTVSPTTNFNNVSLVGTGPGAGIYTLNGKSFSFSGVDSLNYQGTAFRDYVSVTPPQVPWNMAVTLGGTSRLMGLQYISPVDSLADTLTATGLDAGSIGSPGLASVQFSNVATIKVVGQSPGDQLTVNLRATSAPDAILQSTNSPTVMFNGNFYFAMTGYAGLTINGGRGTYDLGNSSAALPMALTLNTPDVQAVVNTGTTSTVNATASGDTIGVTNAVIGSTTLGQVEVTDLSGNVTEFDVSDPQLVLNVPGNRDTINVAGNHPFTKGLYVYGNASYSDSLNDTAASGDAIAVTPSSATITETGAAGAYGPVVYAGIDNVNLIASGATSTLTVAGSAQAENFDFTPTAAGAGSFTAALEAASGSTPQFAYTGIGNGITVNGGASGSDQLDLTCTPGNETIDAEETAAGTLAFTVATSAPGSFTTPYNLTNIGSVSIAGTAGNDVFEVGVAPQVTPAASLNFNVVGSSIHNDQLLVKDEVSSNVENVSPGVIPGSGSVTVGNFNPVTFQGIATVKVQPTVTVTAAGGTYNGKAFSATALVNGAPGLDKITPKLTYYTGTSASGTGSSTAPTNAGTYTVVASYAGDATYASASASATFTIAQAQLRATIVGNPTRPYDGTTTATLKAANFKLTGLVGTQSFTVTPTTGTYDGKDVSTLLPIPGTVAPATTVTASLSASEFTAAPGTLASNYVLPLTATGPSTITTKTLTAAIIGDPTKVHDGTTTATLTPANYSLTGLAGSEGFTITQTVGTYNTKAVGAKSVTANLTPADFTAATGTLAGDYVLPKTATGSGTITATTPATVAITVKLVNHAPTLVAHSAPVVRGGKWGTTVSGLLAAAGAHDRDLPGVFGLAVTATTGAGWQYSTDSGTTWLDLGAATASQARLLDGATRLRRLPGSTGPATLTFRAWDGTHGVAGETDDLSAADSVGGSTAFSQVSVKAVWKS
jgi:hypothetical protein